jgi:hypothetical protein
MKRSQAKILGLTVAALFLGAALTPGRAAAQSELDAAQAQEFLGNWMVSFQSDDGELLVELAIEDMAGKVAGSVTMFGLGTVPVSDITRADAALQFQVEAEAQGQMIPILVRITPNGEEMSVLLEIGGGEVTVEGVGTRMPI